MTVIVSERMRVVPATVPLARAEIDDRAEFARLLHAAVPDNWPPEMLADALSFFLQQLESAPDGTPWFSWYAIARDLPEPTLVGSVGFTGPPTDDAVVETGYSVLPQFQRRGYATEMVAALSDWAIARPDVTRVIAVTEPANVASVRVLEKTGFTRAGDGPAPGSIRFEKVRGAR